MIALLASLAAPGAARAADAVPGAAPAPSGNPPLVGQPANDTYSRPLTLAEQRQLAAKLAEAARIARGLLAGGSSVQSCPVSSTTAGGEAPSSCTTSYKILPMYARQQVNCTYCGPATGQVIINHSRGKYSTAVDGWSTSTNVYHQGTIAYYMWTNQYGTTGEGMANGLNVLARRPANFTYYYTLAGSGSQWHSKVVLDVAHYNMGLAAAVAPWEPGATYRLSSWTSPSPGVRHWIAIRGFRGSWDGTRTPLVYYSDSASGCGAGRTGNFADPSLDVHHTIQWNAGRIVW